MKNLEWPDSHHLQAAIGWLELSLHLEANEELEHISSEMRTHPDVLAVRSEIYFRAKLWTHCIEVSNGLVRSCPENATGWIHRSFALHELKRTQEAFDQLLPAAGRFSDVWTIPYNLACYCTQLNRMNDATDWFKKAMAIDENMVKRIALEDEDLKPLWDNMSGTLWRRE